MKHNAPPHVPGLECASHWRDLAGVDEAGRGPLAGPVAVAAVILGAHFDLPGLDDSKKIRPAKRETLDAQIRQQAIAFHVEFVDEAVIDRVNILQATLIGMQRAVTALSPGPRWVAVDGKQIPTLSMPCVALVGGDGRLACISAASILAKVARDRYMREQDEKFPGYGFARHKGYATRVHLQALRRLGPCALHRRSFAPVSNLDPTSASTGEKPLSRSNIGVRF